MLSCRTRMSAPQQGVDLAQNRIFGCMTTLNCNVCVNLI